MGRAQFTHADFIDAARNVAAEHGPAAVTVGSVMERLKAPRGSFYYRFESRDLLLGELWLTTVLDFQKGFFAAIDAGDGLAAALHMPAWVRAHLTEARLLLLYNRHDFVQGDWPAPLKRGVADQAQRFTASIEQFARTTFGRADAAAMRRARFVLVDVPGAAVGSHLREREVPPPIVDDLIRATYTAIVGDPRPAPGPRNSGATTDRSASVRSKRAVTKGEG
jgi:AcrR family transcriptional regulator